MGRQIKKGIDYFSHDVNMKEDLKIKLLRAKFGLTGYAVYNLLLEDIYKDSYYLKIDEDYILLFSADNNIDESDNAGQNICYAVYTYRGTKQNTIPGPDINIGLF